MSERKWIVTLAAMASAHTHALGEREFGKANDISCAIAICERLEAVLESLERTETHGPHH